MDRKALKQQYKEAVRPAGVFRVVHQPSGRTLLGTSIDVPSMLNRQRAQLRMGGHPNRTLQRDWNADGPDAFIFEIMDTLDPTDQPGYDPSDGLRLLEELWRERLRLSPETQY